MLARAYVELSRPPREQSTYAQPYCVLAVLRICRIAYFVFAVLRICVLRWHLCCLTVQEYSQLSRKFSLVQFEQFEQKNSHIDILIRCSEVCCVILESADRKPLEIVAS